MQKAGSGSEGSNPAVALSIAAAKAKAAQLPPAGEGVKKDSTLPRYSSPLPHFPFYCLVWVLLAYVALKFAVRRRVCNATGESVVTIRICCSKVSLFLGQ